MIYLLRYTATGLDIAAAETDEARARLEAQGYARCTPGAYRSARRLKDAAALRAMWPAETLVERAVGENGKPWWY